jgi:hypothetical protein
VADAPSDDPFAVNPLLAEARGGYIGPSNRDELIAALNDHHTGPVIEVVVRPDGTVRQRQGWVAYVDALGFHAAEDGPGRFILVDESAVGPDAAAFNPVRQRVEARPRSRGDLDLPEGEVDRYVGGFAVRQDDGATTWFVLWHSVMHVTESDDVAPGFGEFSVEAEDAEVEEDEES